MNNAALIFRKEWMSFTGSDRSVFFVYAILVIGWGMLLATSQDSPGSYLPLWIALFSVIVAANFSATVFVAERVSGSLEVLLTSGVSRNGILYGKLLFVVGMTLVIGAGCAGFSVLVKPLFAEAREYGTGTTLSGCVIYCAAAFLNAACSAWLSVVLPNPRLLHLLSLFMISGIMALQMVLSVYFPVPPLSGAGVMAVAGVFFSVLAQREYNSERIIKPVIL